MAFTLGNYYDFITYAPAQLGGAYMNQKVTGIVDMAGAMNYRDVTSVHEAVYPSLPPGVSSDPRDLTYYVFTSDGNVTVLAEEWIDSGTVNQNTYNVLKLTARNVTSANVAEVRRLLIALGITDFETTLTVES